MTLGDGDFFANWLWGSGDCVLVAEEEVASGTAAGLDEVADVVHGDGIPSLGEVDAVAGSDRGLGNTHSFC